MDPLFLDMLLRLCLALGAGGLVGLERERRDRPAGLRTHILVCVGSTLIMLISSHVSPDLDRTRIAANIVTGIGFLGAGTIFRAGSGIQGLTTAAGLWVVAGIGMGIGAGGVLLSLSLVAAVLVYAVNHYLRGVEDRMVREFDDLTLRITRGSSALAAVFEEFERKGVRTDGLRWLDQDTTAEEAAVRLRVRLPAAVSPEALTPSLTRLEGVRGVDWE
jgi:putative Mg2+ transporter-C (MgtC) family protein